MTSLAESSPKRAPTWRRAAPRSTSSRRTSSPLGAGSTPPSAPATHSS